MPGKQVLDGSKFTGFWMDPLELVIVGLDTDGENQESHFLYDPRVKLPVSEEFVLNVMTFGVKKPVIVTKLPGDERAYVVDGRQRVRVARIANERLKQMGEPEIRVPTVMQRGEEETLMKVGVITNEFNVQDSLVVRARKAQRLLDRGQALEEIAVAFGVTPKAIQSWVLLLDLSPSIVKAVEGGKLSASAAAHLRGLSAEEQAKCLDALAKKSNGKAPTAKITKAAVEGEKPLAPGRKVLKYIVRQGSGSGLDAAFVRGVAFAIGLLDPTNVKGLDAVLEAYHARRKSDSHP